MHMRSFPSKTTFAKDKPVYRKSASACVSPAICAILFKLLPKYGYCIVAREPARSKNCPIAKGILSTVLKGQTINLRTVRKRDLEALYDLHCQIQDRGTYFPQKLDSESDFMERFAKSGFWLEDRGMLLIVDTETDRILGQIAFFPANPYYQGFELGYIVYSPRDRGKGVVSQALQLFIGYLFDLKNVTRLQIQFERPNAASRRVAEKSGFKLEGVAREAIISKGKPVDLEVYSLLRSEWEARNA